MDDDSSTEVAGGPARGPGPAGHDELKWLAGIWLVSLFLRFANLLQIRANDPFFSQPSVDPLFYHEWAVKILEGDWLGEGVFLQGPLYPYLLAGVYRLTGPSFLVPRVLQCILGSFVCVLVWAVARRLFDRRVALLSAGMAACYSMFIFYEGSLLIANLLIPLNLLVLWWAIDAAESSRARTWFGLGALVGLAALARPNMLLAAPLSLLWLLLWVSDLRTALPRTLFLGALLLLGFAMCIAPSAVRNRVVTGEWVLVSASGGMNFFNGNNPDANGTHNVPGIFDRSQADHPAEQNEIYRTYAEEKLGRPLSATQVSDYWLGRGIEYVVEHPAEWLLLVAKKSALFVNAGELWNNRSHKVASQFSWVLRLPLLGFGIVGPLALVGLVITAPRWRELLPLYGLIAIYFATTVLFFALSRYRIPVVPVFIMFAASTLVWMVDQARQRRWTRLVLAVGALAIIGAGVRQEIVREDLSVAYYNLGNKFRTLGRNDEAIEQYRTSLGINGRYLSAHNNLAATLQLDPARRDEAIAAWERLRDISERRGIRKYVERAERNLRNLRAQ